MGATRTISFEGRTIVVPGDATDDEVAGILDQSKPSVPSLASKGGGGIIEVEAPDGTIVEFPDDTPRDVMAGAMRKRFGGPAPVAPQPAPVAPQRPLSGSDLDAMVRGQAPGPAQPAAAPSSTAEPAVPLSERVGDAVSGALGVVNQGVRGAARGAAGLVGLPVDLVTLALNASGAPRAITGRNIERPFLGSEVNKDAVDAVRAAPIAAARAVGIPANYPPNEPQNLAERVVGRVGEEMGAMAVPAGAALVTAARLGREGVRELSPIARYFVEPAAISPGTFLGKEVAAAGAAGSGAAAANELTRAAGYREGSLPQAAGDLAGAFGGLGIAAAATHIGPRIADVFNAFRGDPNFANRVSKDAAVDTIAEAYGLPSARLGSKEPTDVQPIVDAIERGRRVGDVVPGFQESLADRTGSSGLSGLEYSRQAAGSPVFAERTRANTNAIDAAMQANAPAGAPGALRAELDSRRTQVLQQVSSEAAAAQTRFEQAAGRLQSVMHADARGADIRAPLEDALLAAREVERGAWEGVSGAGSADIRPLVEGFGGVTRRLSEAERQVFQPTELTGIPRRFLPAEEPVTPAPTPNTALAGMSAEDRAIAERILAPTAPAAPPPAPAPEPVPVALREATGLRSALTDAQRAAASAGETNRARVIGQYIDAVDGYLGAHMPAEAQSAYEAARGVSRDLNDRFTRPQTAIAQSLDRQQGQYRVPDSGVPRRFVQPDEGRVGDFEALMREAGTDPRAQGALRDQILADVQGLRGPDQIDAYVRSHSRVFERFPDLRAQVEEATGLHRAADAAAQRQADTTGELGTALQPGSSSIGRYLRYGDEASTTAMRGVINSPKPAEAMGELLNFAGNSPQAVEGAKRTFWDIMEGATRRRGETTGTTDGTQPWMPRALKRFLDEPRNRAVAERLYRDDPEHLRNVERIAEAIQGVDTRLRARAPNASGTAQGMSQVMSPETLQSRYYAYQRGQVSGTFLITSIAAVAARRGVAKAQASAINRIIDEALTNPEAAKVLLRENNPANRAILARRAKGWIGHEAGTLVDALDPENEDPVKAAVRRAQ